MRLRGNPSFSSTAWKAASTWSPRRLAYRVGKDQVEVLPRGARQHAHLLGSCALSREDGHDAWRQRHKATAACRLRGVKSKPPGTRVSCRRTATVRSAEIDIVPAQRRGLTKTESCGQITLLSSLAQTNPVPTVPAQSFGYGTRLTDLPSHSLRWDTRKPRSAHIVGLRHCSALVLFLRAYGSR